jgi:molybdopterin-guanine dinucleotide biosynthesis protein A
MTQPAAMPLATPPQDLDLLDPQHITGLVLAGGRGSRMGGADKGLQVLDGRPLAVHALERLKPQVGTLMVNANRHLDTYRALGLQVVTDVNSDFAGPLAGMLAGLLQATTPWAVTVPCDSPRFPADLVARLADTTRRAGTPVAIAATRGANGALQPQPVFCLIATRLRDDLAAYLAAGERKIDRWTARHGQAVAVFDDEAAFANANTAEELAALSAQPGRAPHAPR